eukprot:1009458-Prorocentrum_minimum.AAC.1
MVREYACSAGQDWRGGHDGGGVAGARAEEHQPEPVDARQGHHAAQAERPRAARALPRLQAHAPPVGARRASNKP